MTLTSDDKGSSAVEFALVLPLLVLLLFSFLEIGRLIWAYSVVNSGLRDAGRYAARQDVDCSKTPAEFVSPDVVDNVKRLARTGDIDAGGTSQLSSWISSAKIDVNITCLPNPISGNTYAGVYNSLDKIPTIEIYAEVPYSSLMNSMIPSVEIGTIRARHSEVWTQQ